MVGIFWRSRQNGLGPVHLTGKAGIDRIVKEAGFSIIRCSSKLLSTGIWWLARSAKAGRGSLSWALPPDPDDPLGH
jgi:hypothetical protein